MFKKLFGSREKPPAVRSTDKVSTKPRKGAASSLPLEETTIEDLIVLEHYEEAEQRIKSKLRESPDDLHSQLKLADVHIAQRRIGEAVDLYLHAADEYARDGFYEKGIALLTRVRKLIPVDDQLPLKIAALEQLKGLEHKRAAAVEGARMGGGSGLEGSTRALEVQRGWSTLATSGLISRLGPEQIRQLFAAVRFLKPAAGEVLAREGEPRAELFVVVGAQLEATVRGRSLRSFAPRDILGDAALFERAAWPATLAVATPGLILALDREGLEKALLGNPDPRGLLGVLREQGRDRELATSAHRLRARARGAEPS